MSESQVDLSQIRGDWAFHMNYLTNAIEQTVKRQLKLMDEAGVSAGEIEQLVKKQAGIWQAVIADSDSDGVIPTADSRVQEFIEVSRQTKPLCDAYEEAEGLSGACYVTDSPAEQFTEACRQVRGLCDDLEMMREQRPAN
jgi:hypothetical protein